MLLGATPYEFSFTSPFDALEGVEMLLSTSGRINPGFITVEVVGEDGCLLGSATVAAPYLVDNSYRWFPLSGISRVKGRLLRVHVRYEAPSGQNGAIVAWVDPVKREAPTSCVIGE